jgi:hypothetical protein
LAEKIEGFFEQHGMPFTRAEGDTLWYAEIAVGEEPREFFVFLDEGEGWVYFTVNPFVPTPDPARLDDLCRHLARLNYDVTLAKFVVDEEDDVALTVELPWEGFTYAHFAAAVRALARAANQNYDEILRITEPQDH